MAERRGWLLVALLGLVIAGLLSLVALYLAVLLIWVLVEMVANDRYWFLPLFLAAPIFLSAAAMPFWGVRVFWAVMAGSVERTVLRRSALRLVVWSAVIFCALSIVLTVITWRDLDADFFASLALMGGVGSVAVAPLVALLVMRSPIGRSPS